MKDDERIKMDKGELGASEPFKFIIPDPRRPAAQPGLEVTRFAENEASSPEVVVVAPPPPPHLDLAARTLPEAQSPYDAGPELADSRPERSASTTSRSRSSALGEGDGELRHRSPTEVSPSPHLQSMKVEGTPTPPAPEGKRGRRILGMPAAGFWILVFVLVLLANATAVGVALGVTNSKKRSSATAAGNSSSPTPTSQGIPGVVSPAPINQYCPDGNDSVIIPYDASGSPIVFNQEQPMSFRMHCNTYWAAMGPNPSVRDILVVYAPDMYACLCLCAAYNAGYSDAVGDDVAVGGGICVSAALVRGPAQFCHLQNATGENDTAGAFGNPVDTAVLVGDWAGLPAGNLTLAFGGNLPADQEVEDGAV